MVISFNGVHMVKKIENYSMMTLDELFERVTLFQRKFVDEYMIDLNATAACKRAGSTATGHSAGSYASSLLKDPRIAAIIQLRCIALSEQTGITAGRVLAEFEKIAFANMGDYAKWVDGNLTIKASEELTKAQMAAVSEITFTPGKFGDTVKFKLHNKVSSLELIGKHLRMFSGEPGIDDNPVEPVEVVIKTVDASNAD